MATGDDGELEAGQAAAIEVVTVVGAPASAAPDQLQLQAEQRGQQEGTAVKKQKKRGRRKGKNERRIERDKTRHRGGESGQR